MRTKDKIIDFMEAYINQHGYSPTVREIGKAVGLKSTATVQFHLYRLQEQGLLVKQGKMYRTSRNVGKVVAIKVVDKIPVEIQWEGRTYKLVT